MAQQDKKTSELDNQADITSDDRIIVLDSPSASPSLRTMSISNFGTKIKAFLGLSKSDVGLGNVDNTSDANKPVSTAQQAAIDAAVTPDASSTVKGKLKLTGDLGGTADAPTTPTAAHITGDETVEGDKTFSNLVKINGNLALSGMGQIVLGDVGYCNATADESASSYFVRNDGGAGFVAPFYVGCSTGEIFRVGSNFGGLWLNVTRGLFGTQAQAIPTGADFVIYPTSLDTSQYLGYPDYNKYTLDINSSSAISGVILPDPLSNTIPDGTVMLIGDFYGQFSSGTGYGIVITEPSTGTQYEIYENGALAVCVYSEDTGLWAVNTPTPTPAIPLTPDKFIVKAASTGNFTGSYSSATKRISNTSGTLDGVTINTGDIILLKNQSTATRNGLYFREDSSNYRRVDWFYSGSPFAGGQVFTVQEGTTNADTQWVITTNGNITIDTTSIAFSKIAATNFVDLTSTQTLTNKTLTSPAITTPTGIVKGDVGLGNVDNTSDANKPVSTATQTALNAKADDSAVVHDTGNETVAGVKTFSDGTKSPSVESIDGTSSVSLSTDTMILAAGSASIIMDGSNGFLQVYAVYAATGGFSLGLTELPLTDDYTLAASGAECQRILVDPDANGHTIEMAAQLSAFGEVIFENVSGTYSFDVDDEPISGATVAGGPITIPAGGEKKFYYRNGTNEWRETSL